MPRDLHAERLQRREAVALLRQELDWLEQNTRAIGGEAAAVLESWGNIYRELDNLARLDRD